ncbi:CPBP family intramembrane glutamic endopeptidase [Maricaulis sp.]|uniref:CPBP family intramembrane glutamic endopeptidase n=1 Tax=Maricaulis sp. TaxID=1486257 RepID=UPI003A8E0415
MAGREIYADRQARHRRTWTLAAIVLLVVFMVGGQILGVIPGVMLGLVSMDPAAMDWAGMAYVLFAAFGVSAILLLLWTTLFERRGPATLGLNGAFAKRFARGYGLGLGFLVVVVAIIWLAGGYRIEAGGSLAIASLIPVAWLLAGFIVQGSTEELMFRGWLMGLIASRHGIWLAIAINSILFGLVHGGNIAWSQELMFGLANIVLVGVFLSLYAAKEGSLWGVCGWHAAWNWLLASGFGLPVSGQDVLVDPFIIDLADTAEAPWWLTGGVFGPEASVVTSLVLTAGIVALLLRGRFASFAQAAGSRSSRKKAESSVRPERPDLR